MPLSPKEFALHHKANYPFHEIYEKFDEQLKRGPRGDVENAEVYLDLMPDWAAEIVAETYRKAGWAKVSYALTNSGRDGTTHFTLKAKS